MKLFLGAGAALLTLILFAHGSKSQGTTIVGDVIIENRNGVFNCDSMICPPETFSCHVIKRNNPNDFSQIVRIRKCLSSDGTVLQQQTIYEANPYQSNINVNVVSGGGGSSVVRELTPEEQRALEEYLRRTNERVQEQVANSLSNLEETLRPLTDGTLQNRIQAQVQDSLRKAFNF